MIDTVAPTVSNLEFRRRNGKIKVSFQDKLSGLNPEGVTDRANYVLTGKQPGSRRNWRFPITGITSMPQNHPTNAQVVNLSINNGRRIRAGRLTFRTRSGGIVDLAGNALDGEFTGRFPSGNTQPGGHFVAGLRRLRRIVTASNLGRTNATA